MTMKYKNNIKLFLFLLFFIPVISISSGAVVYYGIDFPNTIFSEDFEYTTSLTAAGWNYTVSTACTIPENKPFNFAAASIGSGLAYGLQNLTAGCPTETSVSITQKAAFGNLDSGRALFMLDFETSAEHDNSVGTPTILTISCNNYNSFQINYLNLASADLSFINNRVGGTDCYFNLTDKYNSTHNIIIDVNFDTAKVNIYDNDNLKCSLLALGTESNYCLTGIASAYRIAQNKNTSVYLDNFYIYSTELPSGLGSFGTYCDTDADCVSGYCFRHACGLKPNLEECSIDSECLSGSCVNNHCTKPSIFASLEASKNEQFGDDDDSNNFISLLLMTLTALSFIFGGARFGSMKAGLIGGVSAFFLLGLFFAIVGWLSAFIILGMLLILLILVIFGFMIGGSSD